MTRFTKPFRVLLIIFLLLILLGTYSLVTLQEIKHDLGITVDWQNLRIGIEGITLEKLTIVQQSSNGQLITAESQNVLLSLSTVTIKHLDVKIQRDDYITKQQNKASQIDLSGLLKTISWAPHDIQVSQFNLSLPCLSSTCNLSGKAQLLQAPNTERPLKALATLNGNNQQLTINATIYQKNQQIGVALLANFNEEPLLTLNTLINEEKLDHWQGTFNLYKINNVHELTTFLQYTLPNQQLLSEIPKAAQANASWQLYFPDGITSLKAEKGRINLNASFPNPSPILYLGYIQGQLNTQLAIDGFYPKIEALDTDLTLTKLSPDLLAHLPTNLQPNVVFLKLTPLTVNNSLTDPSIEFKLSTEGPLNALLQSKVLIDRHKTELVLTESYLQFNTQKLVGADYDIQKAIVSLPFTATLTPNNANITISSNAYAKAQQLKTNQGVSFKGLELTTGAVNVNVDYHDKNALQWSLNTPFTVSTTALSHSLLKTLSWKSTGQINADTKQTKITAKLSNGADLSTNLTLITDYQKKLTVQAKTPDLFFRNTNMFAKTFNNWPELLDISTGKVAINSILFTLPLTNKLPSVNAKATITGLSGIYDRSEFRDLTGTVLMMISNNTLKLTLSDLALTEANPGFDMGPFQFVGEYNASLKAPLAGILTWTKAELSLFAGEVWLKPGELNLAKLPQQVDVQIKNLQLTKILTAYPTEGLNGEGDIHGYLPIVITKTGIDIKEGQLAARQAGYIKFNSPAIKAIGENNPNMKLVTQALENFQYTVLSSKISYNQGEAILGLQIKGRNPDIEDGLPVNLNVNLQENIPALMTTLQLSDRVSEIIQKRVQKRLQQETSKK